MLKNTHANVLVFSGLDPTGGAGIQADIETITSLGAKPCSIITALTVQDTNTVQSYSNVDSKFIKQQALCILNDIPIQCIKLGMIADEEIINVIADIITDYPNIPMVIDPVLTAGGGGNLTNDTAFNCLLTKLIPKASIITPNSMEARALVSGTINLNKCAEYLLSLGCQSVLITGGHEESNDVCNTLYMENQIISKKWPRLPAEFHGSGCTLSSSIATFVAMGLDIESAVYNAQQYTYNTLLNAKKIGHGQLIPNRFYSLDKMKKTT
ncbi:MAG: bifunctional hydroxymethylpyrimidine kinase/phosphomethylpyrimidine kinase [Thiohalomonadales bacterium]